jgi:2-polyprenyl-3-methyl-5-hydroxy-6-metoxy-1,4-benzoquinol methylase
MTETPRARIRSRPTPACPLCGSPGRPCHRGLRDRVAPGPEEWALSRCVDGACALLWLDPMPLEEDVGLAYPETYYTHGDEDAAPTWYRRAFRWLKQGYLARRYGYRVESTPLGQRLLGLSVHLLPRRRRDVDASVMHLPFRPGGRLLEVGCGGGNVLRILAELGWEAEGVDLDAAAVANARSKGLTVHLGRLEEQGFEDGRFHAIVLSHVLEHVHDPRGLLAQCRRLLHPDGVLVLLTPNAEGLGHLVFGASCFTLEPPRHLHIFNPSNLRRLVEGAGLRVTRLDTRSRGAAEYWALSREVREKGRADPGRRRSRGERLGGFLFETAEAVLIAVRPPAGDEIRLLARAGGDPA